MKRFSEPLQGIRASFLYALYGLTFALRSQRNFRIHLLLAGGVLVAGAFARLTRVEWAVLILTVALVIVGELINTSIELLLNLLEARNHPVARAVKDVAAAAVFVSALGAIGVGLFLFGPRLWALSKVP